MNTRNKKQWKGPKSNYSKLTNRTVGNIQLNTNTKDQPFTVAKSSKYNIFNHHTTKGIDESESYYVYKKRNKMPNVNDYRDTINELKYVIHLQDNLLVKTLYMEKQELSRIARRKISDVVEQAKNEVKMLENSKRTCTSLRSTIKR